MDGQALNPRATRRLPDTKILARMLGVTIFVKGLLTVLVPEHHRFAVGETAYRPPLL